MSHGVDLNARLVVCLVWLFVLVGWMFSVVSALLTHAHACAVLCAAWPQQKLWLSEARALDSRFVCVVLVLARTTAATTTRRHRSTRAFSFLLVPLPFLRLYRAQCFLQGFGTLRIYPLGVRLGSQVCQHPEEEAKEANRQ